MSIDPAIDKKLSDLDGLKIPLIAQEGPNKGNINEEALLAKLEVFFPQSTNGGYAKELTKYIVNELQTKDPKERVYVVDAAGAIDSVAGKGGFLIFHTDHVEAELFKSVGKAVPAELLELGDQPGPATMKVDGVTMQVNVQTPNEEARLKPFGMPFDDGLGYGEITTINGRNAASLPDHDSNGVGEQLDIFLGSGEKPGAHFFVFSQTTKDKSGAKKLDEPKVVIAMSMKEAQTLYAETWADKAAAAKNYSAVTEMTGAQFTKWTAALDEASKGLKGVDGKVPLGDDGKPVLTPAYLAVADAAQWGAQDGNAVSVFKQPPPAPAAPPPAQTPPPPVTPPAEPTLTGRALIERMAAVGVKARDARFDWELKAIRDYMTEAKLPVETGAKLSEREYFALISYNARASFDPAIAKKMDALGKTLNAPETANKYFRQQVGDVLYATPADMSKPTVNTGNAHLDMIYKLQYEYLNKAVPDERKAAITEQLYKEGAAYIYQGGTPHTAMRRFNLRPGVAIDSQEPAAGASAADTETSEATTTASAVAAAKPVKQTSDIVPDDLPVNFFEGKTDQEKADLAILDGADGTKKDGKLSDAEVLAAADKIGKQLIAYDLKQDAVIGREEIHLIAVDYAAKLNRDKGGR